MKKRICHITGAGDFYGIDLPMSNKFIGKPSTVTVLNGTLLIVFPRKYKEDLL